jgi:beta-lysine 5,6-aminomutase alpha subunit
MSDSGSKLDLDPGIVAACREAAARIAAQVSEQITGRTTVSVERSVTRLLGMDGADGLEVPLPNVFVDHVHDGGGLGRGVAYWVGNAMLQTGRTPQQIAEAVSAGDLDLFALESAEEGAIRERVTEECATRLRDARASRRSRGAAALCADGHRRRV